MKARTKPPNAEGREAIGEALMRSSEQAANQARKLRHAIRYVGDLRLAQAARQLYDAADTLFDVAIKIACGSVYWKDEPPADPEPEEERPLIRAIEDRGGKKEEEEEPEDAVITMDLDAPQAEQDAAIAEFARRATAHLEMTEEEIAECNAVEVANRKCNRCGMVRSWEVGFCPECASPEFEVVFMPPRPAPEPIVAKKTRKPRTKKEAQIEETRPDGGQVEDKRPIVLWMVFREQGGAPRQTDATYARSAAEAEAYIRSQRPDLEGVELQFQEKTTGREVAS